MYVFDTVRGLTNSYQTTWTYCGRNRRGTFQELTVFNEIAEAVGCRRPLRLVRSIRNYPAVDSILYGPNDPNALVTFIQITMNEDHAITVSGLELI